MCLFKLVYESLLTFGFVVNGLQSAFFLLIFQKSLKVSGCLQDRTGNSQHNPVCSVDDKNRTEQKK